jgi:Ion channel
MFHLGAVHLVVVAATVVAVASCVLLQYEGLVFLWRRLATYEGARRAKVVYAILSVILIHVIEIWLFGTTIWALLWWPAAGALAGPEYADIFECVYLSAVTFSTVGFGDIAPVGPIRFLSATEALCGFVLITWSASFTYLEMEKFWRADELDRK